MAGRKATAVKAVRNVKATSATKSEEKVNKTDSRTLLDEKKAAMDLATMEWVRNSSSDVKGELNAKRERLVKEYLKVYRELKAKKEEKNEPIDIYIGEYWYNGKCIKTYQKDPVVTEIEITVSDYVNNYDSMVAGGERYQDFTHELLQELKAADAVLTQVNDKRKKNAKSNIFIAGSKLIEEMEKVDPGSFSKEGDLEHEEIWARGEGTWQQLWFSCIRVLLHAGVLKNDFDNGIGFRLINATLSPKDPILHNLMVNKKYF